MEQFDYAVEAFKDESTIDQLNITKGGDSEENIKYTKQGVSCHVYIHDDAVELQFLGWQLVLLKDGRYYISDTSGG